MRGRCFCDATIDNLNSNFGINTTLRKVRRRRKDAYPDNQNSGLSKPTTIYMKWMEMRENNWQGRKGTSQKGNCGGQRPYSELESG